MKTINVTFEDKEIKKLTLVKGQLSWHDFIMQTTENRTITR